MKRLMLLVIVLVGILGVLIIAGYIYATKNEAELALRANIEKLTTFKDTSKIETEHNEDMNLVFESEVLFGDKPIEQPSNSNYDITIDVDNDKVSYSNGYDDQTIEEYMKDDIFGQVEEWARIIDERDYDLEDNGNSWIFIINSSELQDKIVSRTEEQLLGAFGDTESQGYAISDPEIQFNGDLIITLEISKDTYKLQKATAELTDSMVVDFMVEFLDSATVDALKAQGIEEVTGSYSVEDLVSSEDVKTFELSDNKNWPTNPLLLFIEVVPDLI